MSYSYPHDCPSCRAATCDRCANITEGRGCHLDKATDISAERPPVDTNLLNHAQRQVFDGIVQHANAHLDGRPVKQLLLNVDGTAGTGKSFLIDAISQALAPLSEDGANPLVRRVAPTGVAAYNIAGQTCHSAFGMTKVDRLPSDRQLARLQDEWKGVRYLIVDEKSMIGRLMFYRMSANLQAIFPEAADQPFGGLSVILCGDFGQLPPVGDSPIYTGTYPPGALQLKLRRGHELYLAFDHSITLSVVMRQAGTDPETVAFKDTLSRVRLGAMTPADYALLEPRCWDNMTQGERKVFDKALRIVSTRKEVAVINEAGLRAARSPVLLSRAMDIGTGGVEPSADDAQNIPKFVQLMIGAIIMLTRNLWIGAGLVNGTMGTIHSIGLPLGNTPFKSLPAFVMVAISTYVGPTEWYTEDGIPLVPIVPVQVTWDAKDGSASRTQLPFRLAYAITIHKSQGLTLDRIIIDLGKSEFSIGLSFVGLSRVRTLRSLALRPGPPWSRFENLGGLGEKAIARRARGPADELRRSVLGFDIQKCM